MINYDCINNDVRRNKCSIPHYISNLFFYPGYIKRQTFWYDLVSHILYVLFRKSSDYFGLRPEKVWFLHSDCGK